MQPSKPTQGAPLTAALIRAGNLPRHEREQNVATRVRIGRALYEVAYGLTEWKEPKP